MAFQNRPEFHVVVCSLNGVTLGSAILRSGHQSEALQQLLGGASILLARTLVTLTSTINPSQAILIMACKRNHPLQLRDYYFLLDTCPSGLLLRSVLSVCSSSIKRLRAKWKEPQRNVSAWRKNFRRQADMARLSLPTATRVTAG